MIKIFLITIFILNFSISAGACVVPFRKIILSKTSLEKNPISVRGSSIFFDKGTNFERHYKYNLDLKKWCIFKDTAANSDCNLSKSNPLIDSSETMYADIEIIGNRLKVYGVTKEKKFSRTKFFIEFKDISKKDTEALEITSTGGSKITTSYNLYERSGVQYKSTEIEPLDLSKRNVGTIGCSGRLRKN